MGGMKKKPVGNTEKSGTTSDAKSVKKDDSKKTGGKPVHRQKLSVLVEESQGMKALQGMKAITIQGFARNAGVKISVANSFIKSLETKGVIRPTGGYSGHRVYEMIKNQ